MAQPSERSARRPLDAAAAARIRQRLQAAAPAPWLHGEVARRMAERLPLIRLKPEQVLDWGSYLGASAAVLGPACPQARVRGVEAEGAACQVTAGAQARPWWSPRRWLPGTSEVLTESQVPAGQAQMLWANMQLQGAADPQAVMAQWQRALAVDGFLMFSTLGPGTLQALRDLYRQAGWPSPMAPLVDMHDLGDMLVQAGFADPVMDQEMLTLTWPTPQALLAELRSLGGNADPARHAGLRTPRWREQLLAQLARRAGADGRIAMTFELVYGHAVKPAPRAAVAPVTAVSLQDMRVMVGKRTRPR